MTWQLASFGILAFGIAAGFAWYERSRPSARVLALVAALAALAVVGRLAFAAFPNVKPTTDIVLLAGYALGGAPGFAVGAITPVVSNIFMGHGPWTPWQMVAWGGVGIFGAVLAQVTRGRELGRLPLALACAFAGAAFGAVMDTYQWTLAAEQDAATWIAVSASSLPYNLAHVIGNVIFCLLIGPGLLRALSRYRRRFEVRWAPAAAAAAGVLLLLVVPAGAAASAGDRATAWLADAQNRDGGFGSAPGQTSGDLFTGWASLGVAAGGRNPRDVERRGKSPIDFIRGDADGIREVGEVERTILVLEAAGLNSRSFAGNNFVARLERYRRADGSFSGFISYTAFGILALRAADAGGTGEPASWLAGQRNGDDGFGLSPGAQSDVDNTAAAMQALAAAGRGEAARAVDRLLSPRPEHGRRLRSVRGTQLERAVDRVRGSGACRGRPQPGSLPQGRAIAGRLPPLPPERERQRRLLALERADAGLGDRAGGHGVRAQAVPARRRTAPERGSRRRAASGTADDGGGASPAAGSKKAKDDKPRRRTQRSEPTSKAQDPSPWTGYAPASGSTSDPAPADEPRGSGPSWPGVILTLGAAGLAYYGGRRARATKVITKRAATAP